MPNWCSNTVEVSGPGEEVQQFVEHMRSSASDFDFNQILQMPEEIFDIHTGGNTIVSAEGSSYCTHWRRKEVDGVEKDVPVTDKELKELTRKYGACDWHEWACENWGTKWNTNKESVSCEVDNGRAMYRFDTAWTPPSPVIEKASKMFPKLQFVLKFDEPGVGWYGMEEYGAGKRRAKRGSG